MLLFIIYKSEHEKHTSRCQLVILTCKYICTKNNEKNEVDLGQADTTLVNYMGKDFSEVLALVIDIQWSLDISDASLHLGSTKGKVSYPHSLLVQG